jgi:hypothetical protein
MAHCCGSKNGNGMLNSLTAILEVAVANITIRIWTTV